MPADPPLIRRLKEGVDGFSRNQRVLARYVLANHQAVAFSTISQIAENTGVSEATIVRFAQALDFTGYPAFQKEVRRLVRAELRSVERFQLGEARTSPVHTPIDIVADKERDNLSALYDTFDVRVFAKALALLRRASEVVVVGTRSSAPLAYHLWFALARLEFRATRVTEITSETYDYLSRVSTDTCVVMIGYPRYLREQVKLLNYAKARKLATLTITDSVFSPFQGDVSLYAPAESASFVAFHCSPLVLINALVHALSVADKAKTLAALERSDALAERQEYFVKD